MEANKTVRLRVAGVPEHFNSPWRSETTVRKLEDAGIELEWSDFPGGTGAMCSALGDESTDVALLLTEGAVVYAAEHPDIALCGVYVNSPLVWGVHVGSQSSSFQDLNDLTQENTKFAISRFGSGSHLMAFVLAQSLGWDLEKGLQFEVVDTLAGARNALPKDGALVFMWEKFMTAPFVETGEFRRIGVCPTPWPCFVVAARRCVLDLKTSTGESVLNKSLDVVRDACVEFKNGGEVTVKHITDTFGISTKGAETWLKEVEFKCERGVPTDMLEGVIGTLGMLGRFNGVQPTVEQICVQGSQEPVLAES